MDGKYGFEPCLTAMAARIDESELSYDKVTDGRGWGQFLDGPKEHPQVGPYGVCSGVIVRSMAGRDHQGPQSRAVAVLVELFQRFRSGAADERRFFAQNLRLAFLCLALRLAGPAASDASDAAEQELLSRQLNGGLWGDWWIDEKHHDPTPRAFVASVVVLCLMIFRRQGGKRAANKMRDTLKASAKAIATSIKDVPDLPVLSKAAALVALGLASEDTESLVRKHATKLAVAIENVTSDMGVYFFDFQYLDETGQFRYSRDYFIVPIELLIVIVGFLPKAGAGARLRAIEKVELIKNVVMTNRGAYHSWSQQRISTKNQAWAAMVLKFASLEQQTATIFARFTWFIRKPRSNRYVDKLMPAFSLLAVTGLVAVIPNKSPLQSLVCALCALVIGGLYTPTTFRQLIEGRP